MIQPVKRCISDRIQNYIEMFMDRIKYGFEYDIDKTIYKLDSEGNMVYSHWSQKYDELFKYTERRRWLPMLKEQTNGEEFERMRKDMLDFYFNNVRSEMEYTNKNPRTVAAAILYKYLHYYIPNRILLKICGTGSITNIKNMFSTIESPNYQFELKNAFGGESTDYERYVPVYCTLSKSYKFYMNEQ